MKIGTHSIPKYRLPGLIEDTKKIYEQFNGKESELEFVAHTIGHLPKSGSFMQKLADLRSYGLIEGRGKIKVSELGKKVTYGTEPEKVEALEEIIKNIPLWGSIFDKYGVNIKEENFWVDLAQITSVERLEAQTKANEIRKAYLEDIRYYKPVEKPPESLNLPTQQIDEVINRNEKKMTPPQETRMPIDSKVKPEGIDEINLGDIRIWIPKGDAKAVSKAKKLLDIYIEDNQEDTTTAS